MIWANKENQNAIENIIQSEADKIAQSAQSELESKLQDIQDMLDVEMNKFLVSMDKTCDINRYSISVNEIPVEMMNASNDIKEKEISKDDIETVMRAGKQMYDIYQNSKLALNIKDMVVYSMPSVASNIGGKAVGSLASKAASSIIGPSVGKLLGAKVAAVIPYVGPIIAVASTVLPFLLGDNGAEQRARQEADAQNDYNRRKMEAEIQARQDLRQKCEYLAEDIAEDLTHGINSALNEIIGSLEADLKNELAKNETVMNTRSTDIANLRDISSAYNDIQLQLGNA